ncbi:tetratricopeptide repeat protein [Fulvivirga sp. 29W222]|uniref:Tetratricopeptide repeat protein n=1 Tax=Fulvivirga marina TaxID=2494733 RepID=A0A937KEJ2_9BACT|nr:tetratricopeptide repeat protein [Fulvivirga marina]MBL6449644.1 tetratricopeptide repeat protein [Fulvivirga marina]
MKFALPAMAIFFMLLISCSETESILFEDKEGLRNLEETYQEYSKHYADPAIAYKLLESIKVQAEQLGNKEYLAKYHMGYGYLKKMDKHLDEAVTAFFNALDLYQQVGDSLFQAKVLNNIGDIYRTAYLSKEAYECFKVAEGLYAKLEREDKLPGLYENMGLLFIDSAAYEIAKNYFDKGIVLCRKNDVQGKLSILHNLYGKLFYKQSKYKEARKSYCKSYDLLLDKNSIRAAFIYGNIGEAYLEEGEIDQAKTWFEKSLALKQSIANADLRPTLNYLGQVGLQKGDFKEALGYFDQVVDLSKEDIINDELDVALENIQAVYENSPALRTDEGFKKSLYYLGVARESKKVLAELQSKLNTLYAQYSVKKGYNEFIYQSNLKNEQQEKFYSWVATGALLLSCLALLGTIIVYRKNLKITAENYRNSQSQIDSVKQTLIESGYGSD